MDVEMKTYSRKRARTAKPKRSKLKFTSSSSSSRASGILSSKVISPEIKCVDVSTTSMNFVSGANFFLLNSVVNGSEIFNCIGRRYGLRSVMVRWAIKYQGNPVNANDYLRFLLVYDRQPNGAFPSLGDVLQDTDSAGGLTTDEMSQTNINNSKRFLILRDSFYNAQWIGGLVVGNVASNELTDYTQPTSGKWYLRNQVKNLVVERNAGGGAAIAGINTGALYMITVGSLGAPLYQLQFNARVRFADL